MLSRISNQLSIFHTCLAFFQLPGIQQDKNNLKPREEKQIMEKLPQMDNFIRELESLREKKTRIEILEMKNTKTQ